MPDRDVLGLQAHPLPARISVSYFIGELDGAGTTVQALTACSGMAERGFDVELVLIRRQGVLETTVPPDLKVVELAPVDPTAPVRKVSSRDILAAVPLLARHLRTRRPTVLWSGAKALNLASLASSRLALVPTRIVLTITNDLYHHGARRGRGRALSTFMVRHFYPFADKVITLSRAMTADLVRREGLPPDLFEMIPPPIDLERIQRLARDPIDHPWLRPGQPPVVLNVARMAEQKGHSILLKAFAEASRSRDLRLIILGEGSQEEHARLERDAQALGIAEKVDIVGFDPNPYRYMSRSAVFVLSSLWEGFGIVLAESMACGCPVVSTECPYGPDEILQGGRIGRLVPPADPSALAEAIAAEIDEPTDAATLEECAHRYSVDGLMSDYEAVIHGLLR
jgi:glycosyltransferase involved in cell wall biosynthesis